MKRFLFPFFLGLMVGLASGVNPFAVGAVLVGVSELARYVSIIPENSLCALLGTIGGAATNTINVQYVPQFLLIRGTAGADLTGDITIQIDVQGDGTIMNLDAAGFDAMSNINKFFQAAADINTVGRQFQLADGLVNAKSVSITIANADAAAVDVYGLSKQKVATFYCTYMTTLVNANSGADFSKFAYLAIPGALAADRFTLVYNDGTNNAGATLNELRADNNYYQTPLVVAYNNIAPARIRTLSVIPSTNRNVYMMKYQPIAGSVDPAILQRS